MISSFEEWWDKQICDYGTEYTIAKAAYAAGMERAEKIAKDIEDKPLCMCFGGCEECAAEMPISCAIASAIREEIK